MKKLITILLPGFGVFFVFLFFNGLPVHIAQAESIHQDGPCGATLVEAANSIGIPTDDATWYSDKSQPWSCYVAFKWQPDERSTTTADFNITLTGNWGKGENYSCPSNHCELTSFHGYPAILVESTGLEFQWHMKRGNLEYDLFVRKTHYSGVKKSEVMDMAEALLAAANSDLPGNSDDSLDNPIVPGIPENTPDVSPFIPDNSGDEVPDPGENQPGNNSSSLKNLGPLATNPLVPLTGGILGTVVGLLISVGFTMLSPQIPRSSPSPIIREISSVTPPAIDVPTLNGYLWDLAGNVVGNISTVISTLNTFFEYKESADTIKQVQSALKTWRDDPTQKGAENYLKNLRNTTTLRMQRLSTNLGNISLVMDGVDAWQAGIKKAAERGYKGDDAFLAVGAEYSKKVLNFALTQNPAVSLINSAVGGITQMVYKKEGRIDIGTMIDKGADLWDKTTQEYAGYTSGSYIPGNYADELAKDANIQRKDQYLHGVRKIKGLVERGKITREEGCQRIRSLRNAQGGD